MKYTIRKVAGSRLKENGDSLVRQSRPEQASLSGLDELNQTHKLGIGEASSIALHNGLRRYGLEGEEAFLVLAARYLETVKLVRGDFAFFPLERGRAALALAAHDKQVLSILDRMRAADPLGQELPTWYQFFVGRRFREGSGKFFTPRTVAAAMAKLLPVHPGAILMDPTCGGGTFLCEAARRWQNLPCQLVGNDVDRMLVGLTELVLALSVPPTQRFDLFCCNLYDADSEFQRLRGKVTGILANPPFSLPLERVAKPGELFALGYRTSDALFLDVCFDLLAPGGSLICLLPHSLVVNAEFDRLRRTAEKQWEICGVITLPEGVFYLTGNTSTRADILHLRKKPERQLRTHRAFFANAPSVGFPLNSRIGCAGENSLEQIAGDPRVLECAGKAG